MDKCIYVFNILDREEYGLIMTATYNDSLKTDRNRALYEIQSEIQGRFNNPNKELIIIDGNELQVTSKTITMIEGKTLEDY